MTRSNDDVMKGKMTSGPVLSRDREWNESDPDVATNDLALTLIRVLLDSCSFEVGRFMATKQLLVGVDAKEMETSSAKLMYIILPITGSSSIR